MGKPFPSSAAMAANLLGVKVSRVTPPPVGAIPVRVSTRPTTDADRAPTPNTVSLAAGTGSHEQVAEGQRSFLLYMLDGKPLFDFLSWPALRTKTCIVEVNSPSLIGRIYLAWGAIHFYEIQDETTFSEDAFYRILWQTEGVCTFYHLTGDEGDLICSDLITLDGKRRLYGRNIIPLPNSCSIEAGCIEAARRLDEVMRSK